MLLPFSLRSLGQISAGALVLLVQYCSPAQAGSFANSYSLCSISNVDFTQAGSSTPGVGSSASQGVCSSSAFADYGVLKGFSSSGNNQFQGTANSQFSIDFFLSDPNQAANTPITLNVPLAYHVIIGASPGPFNGASFSIFLGGAVAPFYSLNLVTSSDSLANNNCPSPSTTVPRCNGEYTGTLNLSVPASINSTLPNQLWISAYGSSIFGGLLDASHTVSLGFTTLPTGVTYSYPDIAGNPANFQLAAVSAGVPEPATFALALAALAAFAAKRRLAK